MLEHKIDTLLMLPFSLLLSFSALSCLLLSTHFGLLVIAALLFKLVEKKLAIFVESKFKVGGKLGLFAHLALNLLLRLHIGHDEPALKLLAAHAPHFTRLVVLVWHGRGLAHSGHFCRAHIWLREAPILVVLRREAYLCQRSWREAIYLLQLLAALCHWSIIELCLRLGERQLFHKIWICVPLTDFDSLQLLSNHEFVTNGLRSLLQRCCYARFRWLDWCCRDWDGWLRRTALLLHASVRWERPL